MTILTTYFKTYSMGGTEGRDLEKATFLTEELARKDALNDNWNDDYTLYKVEIIANENGTIEERETKIADIACGRTKYNLESNQKEIEHHLNRIEEIKNNKRMKDEKKAKEITWQEEMITVCNKWVAKYEKLLKEA